MAENILEMQNIYKHFPGVQALENVDFCVKKGEIHALVGQNGAGKSTLLKILGGLYKVDKGEILIDGNPVTNLSPLEIINRGIGFIFQELNLIQDLSIAQNLTLGKEPRNKLGLIDRRKMVSMSEEVLKQIGLRELNIHLPLNTASVAQQQMIAIGRALLQKPRVLILDEPTSRLSTEETETLFSVLKKMVEKGVSIIYVSHRLDEIYRIAQRVTVLRDGHLVGTHDLSELTKNELIKQMIGENIKEIPKPSKVSKNNRIIFKVKDLVGESIKHISLSVSTGEILGIVGSVGSGKTELLRALFGLDNFQTGEIEIKEKKVTINKPQDAINNKVGLCPEDRKAQGLLLDSSIVHNISLASLNKITKFAGLISKSNENSQAIGMINLLNIVTSSVKINSRNLSGGNQQKVVLAKWLTTDSEIFLFDEPTVGVDVKGKIEIYEIMSSLVKKGAGVIFVTSDPEEAWKVCNRLLVMYGGKITKELYPSEITLDQLLFFVMGGKE
jgi:ribose transport system ATP-binding protein